ncbi:UNVERIFIED_CONTAM: hypothetical protein Sradi_6915500 [Sesamum radiatum]|uniref:Retrotransposon gag domain-containing protein n=1 Tax=Sesamum radiatum TaxID=300843 RepID=A0AAW2JHK6_SESRA
MAANKIPVLEASASRSNETTGIITRSMSKKAYSEVTFHEMIEKDLLHLGGINEDDGDLKDNSSLSTPRSKSSIAPVVVTNTTTLEEQIANLTRAIEGFVKHVQEQDSQISKLMNNINSTDASHVVGKQIKAYDEGIYHGDHSKQAWWSSMTYIRPYTQRIDNLKMPIGYQPPKFQQFDVKGNPKQHVAHFIEICNNAGTYGDHLVKKFVRSLKGNAFDWYTNSEASSIDSCVQQEKEFLNRFYSTRRTVSMIELTNSHQWKEEPVIDYINRWRNMSFNYKDRLSKTSTIEMCIQGMQGSSLHFARDPT